MRAGTEKPALRRAESSAGNTMPRKHYSLQQIFMYSIALPFHRALNRHSLRAFILAKRIPGMAGRREHTERISGLVCSRLCL